MQCFFKPEQKKKILFLNFALAFCIDCMDFFDFIAALQQLSLRMFVLLTRYFTHYPSVRANEITN